MATILRSSRPPIFLALTLIALGFIFFLGGGQLVMLGGSWYYFLAGIALIVISVLVLKCRAAESRRMSFAPLRMLMAGADLNHISAGFYCDRLRGTITRYIFGRKVVGDRLHSIVKFGFLVASGCCIVNSGTVGAQALQPVLTTASAKAIVAGCESYAIEHKLPVAIAVLGPGESLLAFLKLDGALPGVGEVARWKANSSAAYGISSKEFVRLWETNAQIAQIPDVATLEGGLPIYTQEGKLLGGVGVSGASAEQDSACAEMGIVNAHLRSKNSN